MKLDKLLVDQKMARSRAEAQRLIKQNSVSIGGCAVDCTFFNTGKCTCGGWQKVNDPQYEVSTGLCVKVGSGFWRTVQRLDGRTGVDQLNGVGKCI